MCTRTQGKEPVATQETEPDLPARVGRSLAEVWVSNGSPQGLVCWQQQPWEVSLGVSPQGGQHCVCVCVCVLAAQSCPAVGEHMDCKPPASTVHGILKARILEWTVISFSRGSSWPNNWIRVSYDLHWQAGSLSLTPPGKSITYIITWYNIYILYVYIYYIYIYILYVYIYIK